MALSKDFKEELAENSTNCLMTIVALFCYQKYGVYNEENKKLAVEEKRMLEDAVEAMVLSIEKNEEVFLDNVHRTVALAAEKLKEVIEERKKNED